MISQELTEFQKWVPIDLLHDTPYMKELHDSGVYVFRLDRCFGRLHGESDILYIGSNERSGTLYHRFIDNYLGGRGGMTTQRIHHNLLERGYKTKVMVSWFVTHDFGLERTLLKRYEEEHHELPPWNRQG